MYPRLGGGGTRIRRTVRTVRTRPGTDLDFGSASRDVEEPGPQRPRAREEPCAPCRGDGNDPGRHMAGPRVGDDSRAVVGRPSSHRPGWLRTPLRPHARPGQDRCHRALVPVPVPRPRRPGPRGSRPRRWRWSTVMAGGKGGKETGWECRTWGWDHRRVAVGPHVTTGETSNPPATTQLPSLVQCVDKSRVYNCSRVLYVV